MRGGDRPGWYEAGLGHVWLPYTQMKTAPPPLPVARTHGCRIVLADGRELIDGIASWWTACHGYNHPAHPRGGAGAARDDAARHVRRPGARAGADPGAAARRPAARRARTGLLLRLRLGRGRGRDEDGDAVLANRGMRGRTRFLLSRAAITATPSRAMAVCDPDEGMHSLFRGLAAANMTSSTCRATRPPWRARAVPRAPCRRSPASSSSRWCKARAA